MPPQRKSKPRSADLEALAQAIALRIDEDEQMSQRSVAHKSGLSFEQVNSYARGQGNPTYETLIRLCEGLELSLGELMTIRDAMRDRGRRR
jgi:transcriptional regulator with XRE-family HTH domain